MKPECGPENNRTKVLAILWYWPGAERVFPLVIIASQPVGVRYDRKNVAGGYAPDKRRPTRFAQEGRAKGLLIVPVVSRATRRASPDQNRAVVPACVASPYLPWSSPSTT